MATNDTFDQPELIGQNLRRLRLSKDISLSQAAESAGISKSFLSLVESGQRSLKLIDLRRVLAVYGMSAGRFLSLVHSITNSVSAKPVSIYSRRQAIIMEGQNAADKFGILLLRPMLHDSDMQMIMINLPPGQQSWPVFSEVPALIKGWVCQGSILLEFHDNEEILRSGDTFCFDGNMPHIYRNHTREHAELLLCISPGCF
jgi:transcriptional regulator with XRE-family HTH domain